MKKVNNLSKVLCAFGVSTVLIAGVASAASTYPTLVPGMVLVA